MSQGVRGRSNPLTASSFDSISEMETYFPPARALLLVTSYKFPVFTLESGKVSKKKKS